MKIGIYVGSFNPVHKGHIKIVNHLLNKYLDKVIIVPTLNYWDKTNLVNIKDRINMLKYYESDKVIIDTKHNSIEYTYKLLEILNKEYKNDILYLIIGADNIINLDKWKNVDSLLRNRIIVMNRNNVDVYKYISKFKNKNNFYVISDFSNIDISSTLIRNLINKKDAKLLTNYLDEDIIDYIYENKLYS